MAGNFSLDPNELREVAAFLRQSAEEYGSISKQLMNAATTMGSAYDSDDNRAFVSQIEGCTGDLNNMVAKVKQQAQVLKKQADFLEKLTSDNTAAVRQLAN